MVGCDSEKLIIGGIGTHSFKELPDFPFPSPQIRPENSWLLIISQLRSGEFGDSSPKSQTSLARCAQVPDPLCLSPRCDEVLDSVQGEQVDGHRPPFTGLSAFHVEDTRSPDVNTEAGQPFHDGIENTTCEPVRFQIPVLVAAHSARFNHADQMAMPGGSGAEMVRRFPAGVTRYVRPLDIA